MELIVAFTIMLILTSMAVPLARSKVRAERERELRYALRDMRYAIDKYKDFADAGEFGPLKQGTDGYPESLQQLVDGVKLTGPKDQKMHFLRRIPRIPLQATANGACAATRTTPSPPVGAARIVFDIYSKTYEKAPDGTPYAEW